MIEIMDDHQWPHRPLDALGILVCLIVWYRFFSQKQRQACLQPNSRRPICKVKRITKKYYDSKIYNKVLPPYKYNNL